MICPIGKNTREVVINAFQSNNLISESQTTDGAFYVLKPEEFDQANKELNDRVFQAYGIQNTFFTREGNIARFSSVFANLVDVAYERSPKESLIPSFSGVMDLYRVNRDKFGLNRVQSFASAVIMDRMIGTMASRAGITKQEMYGRITFEQLSGEAMLGLSNKAKLLWQIVGENAKLAQNVRDNLVIARTMEASGNDAKTIRLATGWEKGADGKWRYEISDYDMIVTPGFDSEIVTLTNGNKANYYRRRLGDIIRFPQLFEAYPQLKDIIVDLYIGGFDKVQGSYTHGVGIELFAGDKNIAKSGLLHEIQHAIQNIEGFAKGGNVEMFSDKIGSIKKEYQSIYREYVTRKKALAEGKKIKGEYDIEFDGLLFKRNELEERVSELEEKINKLKDIEKSNWISPFDAYQRLAGEVEARNVQTRMGMTPEQRRETLLSETEDVARDEQIVLFNSSDIVQSMLGGSEVTTDMMESLAIVDGWYSPIEKRIREVKAEKQSANKWLGIIGSKDEAIYTGVKGWLESKKPDEQISKKDILSWMRNNRVELNIVTKQDFSDEIELLEMREEAIDKVDRLNYLSQESSENGDYKSAEYFSERATEFYEEVLRIESLIEEASDPTKYSDYQLHGEKTDYKEILVTLPSKDPVIEPRKASDYSIKVESENQFSGQRDVIILKNGKESGRRYGTRATDEEIIKDYITRQDAEDLKLKKKEGQFKSTHWDEPNILVHLRMNTRVDSDGNKVLFVEEVQSDWGQQGKKEGFTGDKVKELFNQLKYEVVDAYGKKLHTYFSADGETVISASEKFEDATQTAKDVAKKNAEFIYTREVAPAPFVTDTNSWTKLGLKVALREAVKQGATRMAWTTGEQQNERFDLSKQVSEISVLKSQKDGMYQVVINDLQGDPVPGYGGSGKDMTPSEMEATIGKDLAQRAIQAADAKAVGQYKDYEWADFRGDGLKVGGKGMIGFYGGIIPNIAKALVKELTGSTTEITATTINNQQQPSISITPELASSVMSGMPLFQQGSGTFEGPTGEQNFNRWKGDNKEVSGSEVQDVKTGQPIVVRAFHGTTNEFYEFDSSVKGNIEGHLGKVNYFTTDYYDAEGNYLSEGADLTGRIDKRQEQVESQLTEDYTDANGNIRINEVKRDFNITTQDLKKLYPSGIPKLIKPDELSRFIAERELKGSEERVLDVYVKLNNPVVLGSGSTYFETLNVSEEDLEQAAEEIADENGISVEEAKEDYDWDIRERAIENTGYGNLAVEALESALRDNGYDTDMVNEILGDDFYETEIDLNAFEQKLRKAEIYENEDNELASAQVIADFFKNLGFDGIILTDVSKRFPGMRLGSGVSHIHVFDEYSNQIKLADGSNVTFGESRDIRFQDQAGALTDPKGAVMVAADGQAIIYALTNPDVSTPLHELAHVYEHYLTDAERSVVIQSAGTKGWTRETSEYFARGFEKYLSEGVSPTPELTGLFEKFRQWLTDIYKGITGSDIDIILSDQMREIYDNMFRLSVVAKSSPNQVREEVLFQQPTTIIKNGRLANKEEFDDAVLELATLELEDDQVRYPKTDDRSKNYIYGGDKYNLMILDRSKIPDAGPFEMSIEDDNGAQIGFLRATISDNAISINLIHVKPENRGFGIGQDIYEYFLKSGYVVKSDKEITDSTYSIYTKLADTYGYDRILFDDGRVGLKTDTLPTPNNQQMSFRNVELSMRRPDKNEIIFVPTEALLQRHAQDQPGFDILQKSNQIGDRVEKAKRFIQNYIEDQRIIDFKTGERRDHYMAVFEPSIVDINDGKISFEDGRHRVLAAMELGITEVPIEVPKSKSKAINSLFTKSTQGVVSSPDLPNLTIPEGWENPC